MQQFKLLFKAILGLKKVKRNCKCKENNFISLATFLNHKIKNTYEELFHGNDQTSE